MKIQIASDLHLEQRPCRMPDSRETLLRCQEWIRSDPYTFPGDDDTVNHFYDVEARNRAAALALARYQVAAEDAAAGRV